jgi:aerobic carbon-monoxide dehydrogenase small subunit
MSLEPVLADVPEMSDTELRELISGNLCRCTGYQGIVEAVRLAARRVGGGDPDTQQPEGTP